jgi:hypothetical protein
VVEQNLRPAEAAAGVADRTHLEAEAGGAQNLRLGAAVAVAAEVEA